jgi:iron uptake system component EfeO
MSHDAKRRRRRHGGVAVVAGLALAATGCASSPGPGGRSGPGQARTVTVDLTPQGCAPEPARISAGQVRFTVTNSGAGAVSEAELRTADLAHILGEQENLTPGLSGGFTLDIQPGRYTISCPGASRPHWTLTVSGKATGPAWQSNPQLAAAVAGYSGYVGQDVASLISHTRAFCTAIDAGQMTQAQLLYPQARVYYERIEPVAEIWGSLDAAIDGRWENPVTVASQFTGFHKIEQLLWEDNTLAGAPQLCAGLLRNEQQLLQLVRKAQYNPLEMASGATDLINEAATSKISGEEERYSNTDFPVFRANVDGAMQVVALLTPYLQRKDPALVDLIQRRHAAVAGLLARYRASPGYDGTGYVEYSTVLDGQRRQLAAAVNALAEAMSQISVRVG